MYITDAEARQLRRDGKYTAPELDALIGDYFRGCEDNGDEPTFPGMLSYLCVTEAEWDEWEKGEAGYSRHARICKKAMLAYRATLDVRKDTKSMFLSKQPRFGNYSDRPDVGWPGVSQVHVTFGNPNKAKGKK